MRVSTLKTNTLPLVLLLSGALLLAAGCKGNLLTDPDPNGPPPECTGGLDRDSDGYGEGCPAGEDCDDSDPLVRPGVTEACDGKDNNCDGKVDEGGVCVDCAPRCVSVGKNETFPISSDTRPEVTLVEGVSMDPVGDLFLDSRFRDDHFMWIANALGTVGSKGGCAWAHKDNYNPQLDHLCRGTVSKIDTRSMKEVGRYFSLTCHSIQGTQGCVDINGKPIKKNHPHAPSRTAVDYNFDVWVANRAFAGQPSATKIANRQADCVDRNGNGKIDTSTDRDGDGQITVDCNGDGLPDGLATACQGALAGKTPEFLGDDDECILMTVNYAEHGDLGRSICLDAGKGAISATDVWVGTHQREALKKGNNKYFKINGATGKIEAEVDMPVGHASYGCTADGHHQIWSTHGGGTLAYFSSRPPYQVGPLIKSDRSVKVKDPTAYQYGIATNGEGHIWLGGSTSCRALRYKPDRSSFESLSQGTWTLIHVPCPGYSYDQSSGKVVRDSTRGIAPDNRGKVWLAVTSGYIIRLDQSIPDGEHDLRSTPHIWELEAKGTIGVGLDLQGNVWGVGFSNHLASMLEVSPDGEVVSSSTTGVTVGMNPYTYSDFTGYGYINYIRPEGRYGYQLTLCPEGERASFKHVSWNATTPPGTSVLLRARSGEDASAMGDWAGPYEQPPAMLLGGSPALSPNPARLLEVEFTLKTDTSTTSPVLHDFSVAYDCLVAPD